MYNEKELNVNTQTHNILHTQKSAILFSQKIEITDTQSRENVYTKKGRIVCGQKLQIVYKWLCVHKKVSIVYPQVCIQKRSCYFQTVREYFKFTRFEVFCLAS